MLLSSQPGTVASKKDHQDAKSSMSFHHTAQKRGIPEGLLRQNPSPKRGHSEFG
jgi:hypothetical protein